MTIKWPYFGRDMASYEFSTYIRDDEFVRYQGWGFTDGRRLGSGCIFSLVTSERILQRDCGYQSITVASMVSFQR